MAYIEVEEEIELVSITITRYKTLDIKERKVMKDRTGDVISIGKTLRRSIAPDEEVDGSDHDEVKRAGKEFFTQEAKDKYAEIRAKEPHPPIPKPVIPEPVSAKPEIAK